MATKVDRPIHEHRPVTGFEIYKWPEFKALCDRLGIAWEHRTIGLKIILLEEELVRIEHSYQGVDTSRSREEEKLVASKEFQHEPTETTNLRNEEWRTFMPPQPEIAKACGG